MAAFDGVLGGIAVFTAAAIAISLVVRWDRFDTSLVSRELVLYGLGVDTLTMAGGATYKLGIFAIPVTPDQLASIHISVPPTCPALRTAGSGRRGAGQCA